MADKDVDEQFAAIMAHWDEEALGIDPFGDPTAGDAAKGRGDADPGRGPGEQSDAPQRGDDAPSPTPPAVPSAGTAAPESPAPGSPAPGSPAPGSPAPRSPTASKDDATPEARTAPPEAEPPASQPHVAGTDAGADQVTPSVVGSAWRRHEPADVEEHFEPPPPAPLPSSEDKHFWTMMGALISGPLLFLYLLLFNRDGNGWWMTFALLTSVAGFVLLVLRQPNERDEDDDGVRL